MQSHRFRIGRSFLLASSLLCWISPSSVFAGVLKAGAAKVDVTSESAGPANDRLFVRALAVTNDETSFVLISVDAVAIGEIGPIPNSYLPAVRSALHQELKIKPEHIMANASHCHGTVSADIDQKTIAAVKVAWSRLEPVRVGTGTGFEDRIMENRRLRLKSGREADVRHAYSLPPDEEVISAGPVDPEIGILRLDRLDGRPLAVVYNFACHPIQGVPGGANTADITGFSSKVIEDNLADDTVALFVQGCGGDVNPVLYKDVSLPRHAEPLGNLLGLSTLSAARKIVCRDTSQFRVINQTLTLPRADLAERIDAVQTEQRVLMQSLRGTSLNLKTFLPLVVKYSLDEQYPSYYSHRYFHDEARGRSDFAKLDAENRRNLEAYVRNIHIMEELTRLNTNLALLQKHQAQNVAAGSRTIDVEVGGIRIGDLVLVTFPGELTVNIGLNIKKSAPLDHTFVAGYTNGYIYYSPTAEQLRNVGHAQEDSDCILAPEWQALFEEHVTQLLKSLSSE